MFAAYITSAYACNCASIALTECKQLRFMPTLTIRNLDEVVKSKLRLRAASHGCSMEEEARQILKQAVLAPAAVKGLGSRIHNRFAAAGGIELTLPERSTTRQPPDFTDVSD
jgi:antitoxin FitA